MAGLMGQFRSPSFTQLVVDAMRKHFPEELADKSWDNTGLLVGNIEPTNEALPQKPIVLLTNDLTMAVGEEAIRKGASVIVSYHPFIFRGYKSITTRDPQQATLLRLASHNIAVYCPHTALDAAPNGINSWLADIITQDDPAATRKVVTPIANPPAGFEGSGYGMEVRFSQPQPLNELVKTVAAKIGSARRRVLLALPHGTSPGLKVRSAAVCAGSGHGVLKDCDVDVFVTGEMAHHDALALTQRGKVVVCVLHSNSERAYLRERLQPLLLEELADGRRDADVLVSEEDKDPFVMVDSSDHWLG